MPEGKLVLGKHSGRHALDQCAEDLGYELTREELDDLYHRFCAVADHRKKGLMHKEIWPSDRRRHARHAGGRGLIHEFNVLVLPGDGIGVEVTREAVRVLRHVAEKWITIWHLSEGLLGGIAIHKTGSPLPEETARLAAEADATLMGAVGLPEFDNAPPEKRPEKGLLGIRQALGVYANLRPVRAYASQLDSSPLKNHLVEGADMIIVRELTGGIYYGTPRGITEDGAETRAVNTMTYTRKEIERVTRMAFRLAQARRKKVTSVDKSNVLENSQLWRRVVVEVARDYPDVALDHLLVDNCAMQLILNPRRFDVISRRTCSAIF